VKMVRHKGLYLLATGLAALSMVLGAENAASRQMSVVGKLNCHISKPDAAVHFGSKRYMSCVYQPYSGRRQQYRGIIRKYGIEVGVIGETWLTWHVRSISRQVRRGALAGKYGGLTVEGAAGNGVGVNVLSGGRNGIDLSPGTQRQRGSFNVTAGVTTLELWYVR